MLIEYTKLPRDLLAYWTGYTKLPHDLLAM